MRVGNHVLFNGPDLWIVDLNFERVYLSRNFHQGGGVFHITDFDSMTYGIGFVGFGHREFPISGRGW